MTGWALSPLARLRAAQARAAGRVAAERRRDAGRWSDGVRGLEARAEAERRLAQEPFPLPEATDARDLATRAAARAGSDARSRRSTVEARRHAERAARAWELAGRESARARELEGKSEALRRVGERWEGRRRAERDGRREREVEEAWAAR